MAANMNRCSVSSLKTSQACIPNGFKSQEHLRPWNKMFTRKKIDKNPHLSSNEGVLPQNVLAGEKLQSNGYCQPRASHLGLCNDINSSSESNQSLSEVFSRSLPVKPKPVLSKRNHSLNAGYKASKVWQTNGDCRPSHSLLSEDVVANEFSKEAPKSSPAPCNGDMANQSEGDVLSFSKFIGLNGVNDNSILPSTIRNPNKAVCTIDAKSSQILTANEMACALFGYDRDDMIRKRLIDLIQLKNKDQKTIMESYLQPNGEIISITGKVVDAVDKNGLVLPVSLWMKRLDYNKKSRCLVAMEPAHRLVCSMFFDIKGTILSCEERLSCLYGFTNSEDIIGMSIHQLIPGFRLPTSSYRVNKNVKKQRATGRTLDGSVFPLSVHVQSLSLSSSDEEEETNKNCCHKPNFANKSEEVYEAIVCVFSSITGLITFFPDGTIHSVNHHFALMLFGYSSLELIGKNISLLIPEFYSTITSIKSKLAPISPINSSMTRASIGEIFSSAKKKGAKLHCPDLMAAEKRRFSDVTHDLRSATREWQSRLSDMKPKDSSTPYRMSACLKLNEISDNSSEDLKMPFENSEHELVSYNPQCSDIDSCSDDEFQPSPVVPLKDSDSQIDTGLGYSSQTQLQSVNHQVNPCKHTNNSSVFSTAPKSKTPESFENGCKNLRLSSAENSPSEKPNSVHVSYPTKDFSSSETLQTRTNCLSAEEFVNTSDSDKNQMKEPQIINGRHSFPVVSSPRKGHKVFSSSEAMVKLEPELALIDAKMEALCVDCDSSLTGYSSADTEDEDYEGQKPNATFLPSIPSKNLSLTKRAANVVPPQGLCLQKQSLASSDECSLPKITLAQSEELSADQGSSIGSPSRRNTKIVSPRKKFAEKTKVERMIASPETLDSDEDSFEFFERIIEKACQNKDSADGRLLDFLDSSNEEDLVQSNSNSPTRNRLNNSKSMNKTSATNLILRTSQKKINVTPETEQAPEIEMSLNRVLGVGGKKAMQNYHKAAIQNSRLQWQNKNNVVTDAGDGDVAIQENLSPLDENVEGDFAGVCQHKDGSLIGINFSVNNMHLETGELMFCLWVSQDLDKNSMNCFTLDFPSSSNEDSTSITDSQVYSSGSPGGGKTAEGVEESYPPCKAFDRNYQNLRTVGHGAFGFVVESLEQSTKMEVIVKYILRSKVLSENWQDDPSLGRIPLEVSLLSQLAHPNIVQVLNVFDSKDYVLMVMEKHGSGMDLFEFIEHKPTMDEGLHSYIFRQLVSAIAYLHRCGIVHRDIKDENIIVNEHFHIKLIDFGSAAYMEPGKMFATFCGTVEYCSPEVLMGNWYDGPELEVWSMGVTLYTLVYGENPFFTVDDILACNFKPPFQVSEYLTDLLCWMLLPDPADRMTVEELEIDTWVFQSVDMTRYSWQEIMALSDGPTMPDYEVVYDEPPSCEDDLHFSRIHPMPSVHSHSARFMTRPHFMSY